MTSRILIIDYDQTRQALAAAELKQKGFQVDSKGPEDIATLSTSVVDVLVWAVGHPALDDPDLLASLRRRNQLKVALISAAHGVDAEVAEQLRAHSDAVLDHPFEIQQLGECLEAWCGVQAVALPGELPAFELPRPKPPTRLRAMTMNIPTIMVEDDDEDGPTPPKPGPLPLPVGAPVPAGTPPGAGASSAASIAPGEQPAPPDVNSVQGDLAETGVAQLLGQMYMESFTGKLILVSAQAQCAFLIHQGVPYDATPAPTEGLERALIQAFAWQDGTYTVEATLPPQDASPYPPVAPFRMIWEGVSTHYPEEGLRDWLVEDRDNYVVATSFFEPRFDDLTEGIFQTGVLERLTGDQTVGHLLSTQDSPFLARALYALLVTGMITFQEQPGPSIDMSRLPGMTEGDAGRAAADAGAELSLEDLEEIPLEEPADAPGDEAVSAAAAAEAEQHYQEGLNQLGLGAALQALELLTRAVRLAPENPTYLTTLASALLMARAGDPQTVQSRAVACLQRALELDATHVEAHFEMASLLADLQQPEAALRHVQAVLQQRPRELRALRLQEQLQQAAGAHLGEGALSEVALEDALDEGALPEIPLDDAVNESALPEIALDDAVDESALPEIALDDAVDESALPEIALEDAVEDAALPEIPLDEEV